MRPGKKRAKKLEIKDMAAEVVGPNLQFSFFIYSFWKVFWNVLSTEGGRAVGGTGAGCPLR